MEQVDTGWIQGLGDHLRMGGAVRDRFGLLWWLVDWPEAGVFLACGPDAQTAQEATWRRNPVRLCDLRVTAGPVLPA